MNKEKLQKNFLEKLLKGQKVVCQDDGDCILIADAHIVVRFQKNECFLNCERMGQTKMLSKMFDPDRYEKAEFTGPSQKLKTVTASELKSEKATTWVDKKLINLFMDRWSDIGIYIKDPREPVILCEGDKCIGIVLPVIVRTEEKEYEE